MKFSRTWAMPSADTFSVDPIYNFVSAYLPEWSPGLVSVDPFARNNNFAAYKNDLNPETSADYHMDAEEFLEHLAQKGVVADVILLDPPYSPRQISECYRAAGRTAGMKDTQNAALYARVRRAARKLCKPGTVVLSFGWNSAGMGAGFETVELMLVAHGGAHNDTICLAERMVAQQTELLPIDKEYAAFEYGARGVREFARKLQAGASSGAERREDTPPSSATKGQGEKV